MKVNLNIKALTELIFTLINTNQLDLARKCLDILDGDPEVKPQSVPSKDDKPKKKRGVAKGKKWTPERRAKAKATRDANKAKKQQKTQAQPAFEPLQA